MHAECTRTQYLHHKKVSPESRLQKSFSCGYMVWAFDCKLALHVCCQGIKDSCRVREAGAGIVALETQIQNVQGALDNRTGHLAGAK